MKKLISSLTLLLAALPTMAAGNFIGDYFDGVSYRLSMMPGLTTTIFIVLGVLTVAFAGFVFFAYGEEWELFENFAGEDDENGMRRMWMFNYQPYAKVASIMGICLGAFIAAVLTMLAVGVLAWGLVWLLQLIIWGLIIVGWILLVGGALALFAKEGSGCLGVIPGGLIVWQSDNMNRIGQNLVDWGKAFMDKLNIFGWTRDLFVNLWDAILLAFATPLILFAGLGLIIIVIVLLLMLFEWAVMKYYNVSRPCPSCGNTGKFEYIVEGHAHPAPLHPGFYGILHQEDPLSGEELPTMLFNGKGSLTRRCSVCGCRITNNGEHTFGEEVHIGIVGNRSSGKSYITYAGLGELQREYGDRMEQVDIEHNRVSDYYSRIRSGAGIPNTDRLDAYRAIQMMLKRQVQPVPYHLFFYDVAGEKFDVKSTSSNTGLRFYRNVQTIVFVLDPTMTSLDSNASDELKDWLKKSGNSNPEKYDPEGTLGTLHKILEDNGRKTKDIDLFIVCAKDDLGYLEACNCSREPALVQSFVMQHMGLGNFVISAKNFFRSVNFRSTSATEPSGQGIQALFDEVLRKSGVKA